MSFGVYCIFYTLTTIYSTQNKLFASDSKVLLYIYQIMLCTSVIMAMYPIWPSRIKHEIIIQTAWNFVLFYMLVFFSGFLVLISGFSQLQFVVFTINIVVVAILTSWRQAALMMVPGFYASVQFYKYYVGLHDGLDVELGAPLYVIMYSLLLIGTAFVIFFRPKEDKYEIIEKQLDHMKDNIIYKENELSKALELKNEFLRNISHEVRTPMCGITSLGPVLYQMYDQLTPEKAKSYLAEISKSSTRLESLMNNILDLSKLSCLKATLNLQAINLAQLVHDRIKICQELYLFDKEMYFVLDIIYEIQVACDEYYIKQTIDNLIVNAINYSQAGTVINITLKKLDHDTVGFTIEDQGIGIPKSELYDIFGSFIVSSRTRTPAGGRGVGLALCKKVIDLHQGRIWAQSDGGKGATFNFTIPV